MRFKGWNMQAVAAVALGIASNIPGLLHAVAPESFAAFSGPWSSIYSFAWILGLLLALTVYVLLSHAGVNSARNSVAHVKQRSKGCA